MKSELRKAYSYRYPTSQNDLDLEQVPEAEEANSALSGMNWLHEGEGKQMTYRKKE